MHIKKSMFLILCGACLFLKLSAADQVVSNTADNTDPGSFRTAVGAVGSGDTITFNLGAGPHSIDLITDLDIPVACTIDGSNGGLGSGITISSSNNSLLGLPETNQICTITGTSGTLSINMVIQAPSGQGSIDKQGALVFIMGGTNTYTENFNIDEGEVILNNNDGFGTISNVDIFPGATLSLGNGINLSKTIDLRNSSSSESVRINVDQGAAATLSDRIQEDIGFDLSITKIGAGTLSLTGICDYTGGTTISEGTLALSGAGTLDSDGDVAITGSGVFDISGASGTVLIHELTTEGSSEVALGSNTLGFGTNSSIEVTGAVNGVGGSLLKAGTGIAVLSGINTYSGGTGLLQGQITLGSSSGLGTGTLSMGNTTILALNDTINASTDINLAAGAAGALHVETGTGTLSGSLNDSTGSYTKTGSGILVLSGTSAFTGNMAVSAGTCTINGVFPGSVSSSSGAFVKGTGSIGGLLTIGSGATLTPGNSIGTVTVGNLALDANSITNIEFDPTSTSLIDVIGTANINGTLNLIQIAGAYAGSGAYEILTAGTEVIGDYNSITGGLPGFAFTLNYTGSSISLLYTNNNFIDTEGLSGNILTFANYLNASAPDSSENLALASLNGDVLINGINSASPARNAFGTFVTQQTMFSLSNIVSNYLGNKRFFHAHDISKEVADIFLPYEYNLLAGSTNKKDLKNYKITEEQKYALWINGFVDIATQAGESQNVPFDFISEGVIAGFDYQGVLGADIGFTLGYAHSQVEDNKSQGSSDISYYAASLYTDYSWKNFYIQGAFWGVFHQIKNRREISYPGVNTKASANIDGWQIDPHLELGYICDFLKSEVQPYIALDYVVNWEGSFTETGAGGLNMAQKSQTSSMLQTEAGIKFYQSIDKSSCRLGFKEGVSYINRTPFGTGTVIASIFGSSDFVTLKSFTRAQNLAAISAVFFAEVGKKKDVIISIGYEGQFGKEYISNEAILTISKSF